MRFNIEQHEINSLDRCFQRRVAALWRRGKHPGHLGVVMEGQRGLPIPPRAGHSDVRRNNLEVVLRHLSVVGPDSRASIAARAGLTPSTVSRLVGELIELGLIREADTKTNLPARHAGRPATRLELDGRHVLALGAEVNVDYIAVLGTDLAGR